ncbi:uncharacterized protein LOC133179295 [Saccostrea echinata]|uniref:uncharacterized protein LOC133179295 n=1 Tax=Saccostrea echinata TaxID=191078 RepID=UPI002A83682B|nr:uncharacterized protein LOC133179295 [Saccostrea echinata]
MREQDYMREREFDGDRNWNASHAKKFRPVYIWFELNRSVINDVILCNVQGVTQCAQSTDLSTLSDPQKSCLEWKKFEECVSPFSDECTENPTYVSFYNSMNLLKSNCGGSTGDSCDVMGLQKCMDVVESSQNENSGLEETCKVYPEFRQCVDPLRKGCADSNNLYNNIKGSIAEFERKCAAITTQNALLK